MRRIGRFLAVTYLWILLLPYATGFIGAASNQLVLLANHDTFPVMINDARLYAYVHEDCDDDCQLLLSHGYLDEEHVIMTPDMHLKFLADIFDNHGDIASIGDLFIWSGEWLARFSLYVWVALVSRKIWRSSLAS